MVGYRRWLRVVVFALGLVLVLAACSAEDPLAEPADEPADTDDQPEAEGAAEDTEEGEGGETDGGLVRIGSTNFSEQLILANMYALVLEENGYEVETRLNLGNREIVFPALQEGEIDVLPEYTGALLNFISTEEVSSTETDELVAELHEQLDGTGATVLEPSPAQDRDGLVVTPETAETYDLVTVSDLAPVAGELKVGGPPGTFEERFTGLPGLKEVYGIEFGEFVPLDSGGPLTVAALENGDIDVGRMFTTQGIIGENDWVLLEEDEPLIPAENIIPAIREDVLDGQIEGLLNELSAALTTEILTELNRQVDSEQRDPDVIAEDWLRDNDFIS